MLASDVEYRRGIEEDAAEISDIVRCALRECRISRDLRERLAAVLERSDRIARNVEIGRLIAESAVLA
jgi:hypothetical protein